MGRKIIALLLVISLAMNMVGCETVMRKFTRKKKAKPVRPMFYIEDEETPARPPVELYMVHYVYWKTWMDDLIANAGKNLKRDKRASIEAVGNLVDMKKYLVEAKKGELEPYIKEVERITDAMLDSNTNQARLARLKQELDKVKRRIVRKFYYKKVRDCIIVTKQ